MSCFTYQRDIHLVIMGNISTFICCKSSLYSIHLSIVIVFDTMVFCWISCLNMDLTFSKGLLKMWLHLVVWSMFVFGYIMCDQRGLPVADNAYPSEELKPRDVSHVFAYRSWKRTTTVAITMCIPKLRAPLRDNCEIFKLQLFMNKWL